MYTEHLAQHPKSESQREDNLNTCLIPNALDSSETDHGCRVYKGIPANISKLFMDQQRKKVSSSSPIDRMATTILQRPWATI